MILHHIRYFPYFVSSYQTLPFDAVPYHTIPNHTIPYHTIPYHTVPNHTIPNHTIPYRAKTYHIIIYHIILHYIISYHIFLYHSIPYHITSYHTIPYHIISYHAVSYHIILCHIISYLTIPYRTISYHIILYHIILCHTLLYHIILYLTSSSFSIFYVFQRISLFVFSTFLPQPIYLAIYPSTYHLCICVSISLFSSFLLISVPTSFLPLITYSTLNSFSSPLSGHSSSILFPLSTSLSISLSVYFFSPSLFIIFLFVSRRLALTVSIHYLIELLPLIL